MVMIRRIHFDGIIRLKILNHVWSACLHHHLRGNSKGRVYDLDEGNTWEVCSILKANFEVE